MAVVIVIAIGLAFAAGFTTATFNSRIGPTAPSSSSTSSTSAVSTLCTIPDEGGLVLRILNSSTGQPISSVPVQVQNLYPECPPNPHTTENLGVMTTDANGTIITGGLGEFYFGVNDSGYYSVDAGIKLGGTTCVTLEIPSGEVHIWYSGLYASTAC